MKRMFYLGLFLALFFDISVGFAQEADADSVVAKRPKFSMTPT